MQVERVIVRIFAHPLAWCRWCRGNQTLWLRCGMIRNSSQKLSSPPTCAHAYTYIKHTYTKIWMTYPLGRVKHKLSRFCWDGTTQLSVQVSDSRDWYWMRLDSDSCLTFKLFWFPFRKAIRRVKNHCINKWLQRRWNSNLHNVNYILCFFSDYAELSL